MALAPAHPARGQDHESQWDARAAEHLWNRAGFGASGADVARALEMGRAGFVAWLADPGAQEARDWLAEQVAPELAAPEPRTATPSFDLDLIGHHYPDYYEDIGAYLDGWIESMLAGRDPLRDRMALFWHNHFTSSFADVQDARKLAEQARFLRANALGTFGALLRGIARDPAMLAFLDNDVNVRAHPNENWARELLELFTLGEGHYSERDVQEVARAFTGWTERDGRFFFDRTQHDYGAKTVLGITGNLDGDDVIEILLADPSCARFLAAKLLLYFEGLEPDAARTERYAQVLAQSGYDLSVFAETLFLDDAFYRPDCVGASVAGPVEYLVGTSRRLGIEPPVQLVCAGAQLLGQRLFDPPTVKGWEGGLAWLGTGDAMHRGNLVAALLGHIDWTELVDPEVLAGSPRLRGVVNINDAMTTLLYVQESRWHPALALPSELSGADDAAAVAGLLEEWLAIEPPAALEADIAAFVQAERARLGFAETPLAELGPAQAAALLARAAQIVASLPAAQLQ